MTKTSTRAMSQLAWTITILSMAALCLFSAMREPSFAATNPPAGVVR